MRRQLERVPLPGEHDARERARRVVLEAFADREPLPRSGPTRWLAAAAAVAAAIGLAVASPPGRAVVDRVREAVGVQRSEPALFSLPGGGRLLVSTRDGAWVVRGGGDKRRLGGYAHASWSPFGRFVVATTPTELAILEPDGDVRWTLARRGIRAASWGGTETDTRIAYSDRTGLRVVAGDGTGDRLLAPSQKGPIAWRPGAGHVLAYVAANEVRVQVADSGRVLWRARLGPIGAPRRIVWSTDGRRLLVASPRGIRIYDRRGALVGRDDPSDGARDTDAAFRPGTHRVVVARAHGAMSTVVESATGRSLFEGTGSVRLGRVLP